MSRYGMRRAGWLLLVVILAGCATPPPPPPQPRDRIILLAGADGKVGKLAVNSGAGSTVLDEAYGSATVNSAGQVVTSMVGAAEVTQRFGETMNALPPRPVSHLLYFEVDSDRLTDDSRAAAAAILADIAARPVADIVIIGHTDSMGDASYNDQLSLTRAEALRAELVREGGDAARISVAGRGERELLITTPDETPEPRNRRAEISVR